MIEASAETELVAAFANTIDLDDGTDALASAADAAGWLLARRLVDRPVTLGRQDHRKLLDLRAGVRDALAASGTPSPHLLAVANAVLRDLPVLVYLSDTVDTVDGPPPRHAVRPDPALPLAQRAMAVLAVAWSEVVVTGQARRLKRCADETCGWVFWDVSRNHSRRWCTMRVCGNRAKSRSYSARQRADR
ncbi:CGNR zinc finger domain-containing protein [Solihabitans fulvus]|uniref:CGNR zinc finger domain-containing protein n=1 Tax=Solihabitans fulvus TaxID=1892852 RepID=A0A5B2WXG4_9PSEU|nr:CGNR zinc finger domain-containing protein [Solihabitans fulvus]KAA2255372.1 CGNR zinc finger domain-containing protein [Solihabitans fulvus]